MSKPQIIVLIGAYWPGHESAGPNLSVKAMCETLCDQFEFLLIARDRPFGAEAPMVPSDGWRDLPFGRIHYLPVGPKGAIGLAELLNDTPHDLILTNGFFDKEFTIPTLFAMRMGKIARKPVLLSPRGEFSSGALGLKSARKRGYLLATRIWGVVRDTVFHVTSDEEERDTRRLFPNNQIIHITNVRPIFPLPPFEPRASGAPFRAAFLGRISEVKGLDVALRTLQLVKEPVHYSIYGPISDPAHWAKCQSLITTLPAHVTAQHCGELTNDGVPAAMAAQDLLFLPSRSENFGHAIFEALCSGTPVMIGEKTPWRHLSQGQAGYDLPLADLDALARTIDDLARLSAIDLMAWRTGARTLAEKFVSESKSVSQMAEAFHNLIANPVGHMS